MDRGDVLKTEGIIKCVIKIKGGGGIWKILVSFFSSNFFVPRLLFNL